MYDEVKHLVSRISEEVDDYPDMGAYRQMMEALKPVKDELAVIEENRSASDARKDLMERRDKKADEEWENADLGFNCEEDVHIESDGWSRDGTYYSRKYYVSLKGAESYAYSFSLEFEEGSDTVQLISNGNYL